LIGQFLLVFRKALEAVLIKAMVLAYLAGTRRKPLIRYARYGVYLAVAASFALGAFIWSIYSSLSGPTKALFERVAALFAVFVLSSCVIFFSFPDSS